MQYNVITEGVDVFGVNQQPIHVEQTGPHGRKALTHVLAAEDLGVRNPVFYDPNGEQLTRS